MELRSPSSETFVPDGAPLADALARTTCMGIGAHHDDLEIMAIEGILRGYDHPNEWFTGVVVTDGSGSPRAGEFADFSDGDMKRVRAAEQKKAAMVGRYGALAMLAHPSAAVKDPANPDPVSDIAALVQAASPEVVYTHNPMDKHDTHVALLLRVVDAIRALPREARPKVLLGGEVWRDLDWLIDADKVVIDCSAHQDLQERLVAVFESQIAGGKRYDLAAVGRRRAHATYHESHDVDAASGLAFAIDMTPLIEDDSLDVGEFARSFIAGLSSDVSARIGRFR